MQYPLLTDMNEVLYLVFIFAGKLHFYRIPPQRVWKEYICLNLSETNLKTNNDYNFPWASHANNVVVVVTTLYVGKDIKNITWDSHFRKYYKNRFIRRMHSVRNFVEISYDHQYSRDAIHHIKYILRNLSSNLTVDKQRNFLDFQLVIAENSILTAFDRMAKTEEKAELGMRRKCYLHPVMLIFNTALGLRVLMGLGQGRRQNRFNRNSFLTREEGSMILQLELINKVKLLSTRCVCLKLSQPHHFAIPNLFLVIACYIVNTNEHVDFNEISTMYTHFFISGGHFVVHLSRHPLQCRNATYDKSLPHRYINHIYKRNTTIAMLKSKEKVEFSENCPERCYCFVVERREIWIRMNCENKSLRRAPSVVPFGTKVANLKRNQISSLDNLDMYWWQNLLHLDISKNAFKVFHYQEIPPKVTTLLLDDNSLTGLPLQLLERIEQLDRYKVSLSGNNWKCSCDHMKFIQWIKVNSHKVRDYNNMSCYLNGGSKSQLVDVPIKFYCAQNVSAALETLRYTTIFVLLSISISLLLTILYIHRLLIFAMLYRYNLYPTCFDRNRYSDRLCDLFACYHINDREVANIVLSILGPSYCLCVQELTSSPMPNADSDFIFNFTLSKKVLLFVSRTFGKSYWFQTEFKQLYDSNLRHYLEKLIVIIIRDPETDYYLEDMIQSSYWTEHLLHLDERWFWEKLRFLLRNSSRNITTE